MRINNINVEGDYTVRKKPLTMSGNGRKVNGMTVYGDVTQKGADVTRSGVSGALVQGTPAGAKNTVSASGITPPSVTVAPSVRRAQSAPYNPTDNTYGGRAIMRAAGLSDSDIGYDGQYVTYKGNKLYIPSSVENGTSYAPKATIYGAVNTAYKNDGTPLVQVNRYQNKYGITDGYGYNDKTGEVTLGGAPIDYAYIDEDGNAWAREDVLSSAYDRYADELGIREPGYYKKQLDSEIDSAQDAAARAVGRMKSWDYSYEDMKNDPIYRAYAEQYLRDGARAYKDTLGTLVAQSGGGLSSAALAAAGAAQNEYMKKLSDNVPSIAQYAYERFLNGEQADIAEQAQRRQDALSRYSAGYGENSDLIERQKAERQAAYDRFINDIALRREREDLAQTAYDNLFKRGQLAGSFTDEERARAGTDNPYAGEMAYNLLVKQPQYEYERSRDDYYDERKGNRDFEHDKTLVGVQSDNDLTKLAMQYRNEKELQGMQNRNDLKKIEAQYQNDKELAGIEQEYKSANALDDAIYNIALSGYKNTGGVMSGADDEFSKLTKQYIAAGNDEEAKRSVRKKILDFAFGEGK